MAGFLASIQDAVSGLFSSDTGTSVLGVDVGSSSIKVVQLRKKRGAAVLETYGELSLGPYAGLEIGQATNLQAEKLAEALMDVMREANVTTTDAGFSIPFSSSLTSFIELPKVGPKQLEKMVPIEARKYIPVPISEVTLDWFEIPEEQVRFFSGTESGDDEEAARKPRTHVLLVAIHNETIKKFQRIIEAAKLVASFFEIEIFSAVRAVLDQGTGPVLVIDMGAGTTKLYIVEYGIVRLSHVINKGSQDITLALSRSLSISIAKAERMKREFGLAGGGEQRPVVETSMLTLDYVFNEINRVLLSYQQKSHANIERVTLTGGGASLQGILPLAEKKLEAPVTLADPFAKTETPAFLGEVLEEAGPTFSVATGLALRKLREE